MELFRFFQIDLFAMALLSVILFVIRINQKRFSYRLMIFRIFIYSALTILLFECFVWLVDGVPGSFFRFLVYLTNSILIIVAVMMPAILSYYVEFTIFQDQKKLRKKLPYYFIPSGIMLILALINAFYPIIFTVDENNMYADLPLLWIAIGITLVIYVYLVYLVIRNRHKLQTKYLIGVLVFILAPIIGSALQMIFYGLLITWSMTALAIAYMYLVFETTSSNVDYLTGISTRRYAEEYIDHLINRKQPFDVYMIDVDNFKALNDQYGHIEGDKILMDIANILKKVFPNKSVVARYGGDEFIVASTDLSRTQEEIRKTHQDCKLKNKNPLKDQVNCSIGYYHYSGEALTLDQVIMKADKEMYLVKMQNKKQ
ncbi:MAG: diguanylate cyclase [Acholeplasmataceae bacterium]